MKKFINLLSVILLGLSSTAFAEKVMISGEPVMLEQSGDNYTLPADAKFAPGAKYRYVSIAGVNKVCYADKQTNLTGAEESMVNVMVDGKLVSWTCYNYNDTLFGLSK